MAELIELHGVDTLRAGAVGRPGERVFLIEAAKGDQRLSVLVEKEQVALLASEAAEFLDKLAEEYPEERQLLEFGGATIREPSEPLFRARLIGLGFDPTNELVLVELREQAPDDDEEDEEETALDPDEIEGYVARFFATRAQVRAMTSSAAEAVHAGRARWN